LVLNLSRNTFNAKVNIFVLLPIPPSLIAINDIPGIMGASTVVLMIVFPINVMLNIVLVHYTSLGLLGSPVALSITYWLCFVLLAVYTYLSPAHTRNATWGGIQLQATLNPKSCLEFLKLALPGILMVGTEWCALPTFLTMSTTFDWFIHRAAFEIVALAAGRLVALPLAAQSVIMTLDQSMWRKYISSPFWPVLMQYWIRFHSASVN
jgi:multidrug resistance protein, MATE family